MRDVKVDASLGAYLREIADAAQKAISNARSAPAAARDFVRSFAGDGNIQKTRGALDDARERVFLVGLEGEHQAEAAAKRRAEQALARSGSDGGKTGQGNGVSARAGSGANQDIEAEIFQRAVQDLFNVRNQSVNFVDEEDLTLLHVRQHAGEVEFLLKNGSGGLIDGGSQFVGDDARKGGFA